MTRTLLKRPHRCQLHLETLEARNLLTFYGGYRTASEIITAINNVEVNYPAIVDVVDYGNSYSKNVGGVTTPGGQFIAGYDLLALRITNQQIPGPKPVFFLMGGLHAREISTPEVVMKFVDYLTQNYNTNADVRWIVDYHEIVAAPLTNPDGHWYVELGGNSPWYWRKNGRPNSCTVWPGHNGGSDGVDLNRNFNFMWGGAGSSGSPCNDTYRGTSAASEPETQGIQNLVSSIIPDQKGPNVNDPAPANTTGIFLDIHTYGGYILWPWGHTSSPPPNGSGLTAIGNKFQTYNGYTAGQSYQTLYPATATSEDWAYGTLGVPAFTFELNAAGFLPSFSTVNTLYNQNQAALLYAAKIARTPYMTALGPDALSVTAGALGPALRVTATINDVGNGNNPIAGAEYYIDLPPWVPGAQARAMTAQDGSFNSSSENVFGRAFSSNITPGQHILFVRGRDSLGNWGPFSARFFTVTTAPGPNGPPREVTLVTAPEAEAMIFVQPLPAALPTRARATDPLAGPADTALTGLENSHTLVASVHRVLARVPMPLIPELENPVPADTLPD
jgi:hypothetical protein